MHLSVTFLFYPNYTAVYFQKQCILYNVFSFVEVNCIDFVFFLPNYIKIHYNKGKHVNHIHTNIR
ncbi:MAG TPA: hypothetical protein DEP23_07470 [Ruminococcaceae bacterium]|nr:hypothetical protein [Oscillospiraceae bacterium]